MGSKRHPVTSIGSMNIRQLTFRLFQLIEILSKMGDEDSIRSRDIKMQQASLKSVLQNKYQNYSIKALNEALKSIDNDVEDSLNSRGRKDLSCSVPPFASCGGFIPPHVSKEKAQAAKNKISEDKASVVKMIKKVIEDVIEVKTGLLKAIIDAIENGYQNESNLRWTDISSSTHKIDVELQAYCAQQNAMYLSVKVGKLAQEINSLEQQRATADSKLLKNIEMKHKFYQLVLPYFKEALEPKIQHLTEFFAKKIASTHAVAEETHVFENGNTEQFTAGTL